ncbi:MAG: DsbA family protein [Gammaproteobacteria bacterium]
MLLEFFHDPLCAWCYALSPRVRQLADRFPDFEIVQRGFALAPEPDALDKIFGDKVKGKAEILNHWRAANDHDDGRRMRPDLMAEREFDYPWSVPALMGCEAARTLGGEGAYWDYFDRVQTLHLSECRNIADPQVLADCAESVGLDRQQWSAAMEEENAIKALQHDMARARSFGIRGVPALVLEGQLVAQGALTWEQLLENVTLALQQIDKR